MALKQIRLIKKIELKRSELAEHLKQQTDIEQRREKLEAEERQIEEAYKEIRADSPQEDMDTVEELASELEGKKIELENLIKDFERKKAELEGDIAELEAELKALEEQSNPNPQPPQQDERKKREDDTNLNRRGKFFDGMPIETRDRILNRQEVKDFLKNVRTVIKEKRTVTGAELTIPDVLLDLIRDNLHKYSNLIKYVNLRPVAGRARQTISGTIPEAVWTEACAKLNELDIVFNQVDVDGYKIGGYVAVCNATIEDSDLTLASEILTMLGGSLGRGIDKAILYGKGEKMPIGIATRLAQESQPPAWGKNAPAWADLHTTHIVKIDPASKTTEEFFGELISALSLADNTYATKGTFWAMNRRTHLKLMSKAIAFNSAGTLVAGMNNTMPIEGGTIVEVPDMPDDDIMGGFGELYLLAERAGATFGTSEHAKFIEDQTVFKATARYDGMPVIGEGFVLVNIANKAPTTTTTFPSDSANP